MKRAWMPLFISVAFLLIYAGCDPGAWRWGGPKTSPQQQPLAGTPVVAPQQPPAVTANPNASEAPAADPSVQPLAERVQNYVGQFPPDDRDRQAARTAPNPAMNVPPAAPAQPLPQNAAAAAPAPPLTTPPAPAAAGPTTPAATANLPPTARNLANLYPSAATLPLPRAVGAAEPITPAMRPIVPAPVVATQPAPQTEAVASPQPPATPTAAPETAAPPRIELTEVRPAANKSVGPSTQPAASGANQPVQEKAASPADNLHTMIADLEKTLAQHPAALDDQFKLRLLYAANGEEDKAAGPLKGADPVQADVLAAVFRIVKTARQAVRDPAAGSGPAIAALDELRRIIGQQSPVLVPRLALVTRVNSFGDYEAVSPPQFPAGNPVHVFLYSEVSNFRTETTPENKLRTLLAEKVEIFDSSGKVIWQRSEPTIEDKTVTPRHDFFMTMEIQLPADTPAGDYVLKVTVEDKLGATTDQQRMSLSIK